MTVENPERGPALFQIEEEGIRAGLEIPAPNLHLVRHCDGGGFIGAGPPRRTLTGAKAFVYKAVVHQLTPDVPGAVVGCGIMDARTVVLNGDLHRTDPLRDLCALCITVWRSGQLRGFLGES